MAYLPAAGKRYLTDTALVHLPTMREIPNPILPKDKTERRIHLFDPLAGLQLPPSQDKSGEWSYVPPPSYINLSADRCPMRRYCMGIEYNVRESLARKKCKTMDPDPRILPYGLPPDTFDVRKRANWFDYWKEDHYQYAGAYQKWENDFGVKYFYTCPPCYL